MTLLIVYAAIVMVSSAVFAASVIAERWARRAYEPPACPMEAFPRRCPQGRIPMAVVPDAAARRFAERYGYDLPQFVVMN